MRHIGTLLILEENISSRKSSCHFKGRGLGKGVVFEGVGGRFGQSKRNKPQQQRNAFVVHYDKCKKPVKKHEGICNYYGLTRHWMCTCRTPKRSVDLY